LAVDCYFLNEFYFICQLKNLSLGVLGDLFFFIIATTNKSTQRRCDRLKTDPTTRDVPVIFMTALSDTENKVKGLSIGAVDYITKPIQQEEVIARVRIHLQLRNFAQTLQEQNNLLKQEIQQRQQAEAALQQALNNLQQAQLQGLAKTDIHPTLPSVRCGMNVGVMTN